MSKDTIYRQAAIDAVRSYYDDCDESDKSIEERIDALPSAQPERKRGKWIDGRDERFVKCSECGLESTKNDLMGIALFGEKEPHFCPCCGADMRGEE